MKIQIVWMRKKKFLLSLIWKIYTENKKFYKKKCIIWIGIKLSLVIYIHIVI